MKTEEYDKALQNLIDHVCVDQYYTPKKATRDIKIMKDLIKKSSYYLDKENIFELYRYLKGRN